MNPNDQQDQPKVIKLSRDELMSAHVDGLLQRQMNMMGDRKIIERKSRWFYKNWFVFMVVGGIAALIAWALIEPSFSDAVYIQGPIAGVEFFMPDSGQNDDSELSPDAIIGGRLKIRGDDFLIYNNLTFRERGKPIDFFSWESLQEGKEIGIYVDDDVRDNSIPVIFSIDINPLPASKTAQEPFQQQASRSSTAAILLFPIVACMIGLFIGAIDGLICRNLKRALVGGGSGLIIGFIGGFFSNILAGAVYQPLHLLAMKSISNQGLSMLGFFLQMIGRGLAWSLAGMAMGLGYGLSLRSKRLILYGFIGGIIGGLLGGLFFDPIDFYIIGDSMVGGNWSRMIGLLIIGLSVGLMIGLVELFSRDAWLRMVEGPLVGKEFLIFKDLIRIGSSPKNEIYIFKDPGVKEVHAQIRMSGDEYEIESKETLSPVLVNNRSIKSTRLHTGDRISIGNTSFIFEKRKE